MSIPEDTWPTFLDEFVREVRERTLDEPDVEITEAIVGRRSSTSANAEDRERSSDVENKSDNSRQRFSNAKV
jgi:hypothetical protein